MALVNWFAVADFVSVAYHHNIPTNKTFLVTNLTVANAQRYAAQGWKPVEDAELGFAIEDDLPRAFAASPIRMVQDEFVPTLFQHGTADIVVPFVDTVKMAETVNTRVRSGLATVPLPEVGTTNTRVDDGVDLPADDLAGSPCVTVIPTRTVEPVKDRLEFWGPEPAQSQEPQGV
jgi:hypothetical protein